MVSPIETTCVTLRVPNIRAWGPNIGENGKDLESLLNGKVSTLVGGGNF